MTRPQDAALLTALETQYRELTTLLARLQRAQRELIPPPATFWRGPARYAYDSVIDALETTVNVGVLAIRSARDHTHTAMGQVAARG